MVRRCKGAPRGVALINALVVVAALAAVSVMLMQRLDAARARLADLMPADAATLQVQELLRVPPSDAAQDAPPVVHLGQDWAKPVPTLEIDRGQVGWQIADLQGRFNLAWLLIGGDEADAEEKALAEKLRAAFSRLVLGRGLTRLQARHLEQALVPRLGQRVAAYGRATRPPPLPPFALDELLLIDGIDEEALAALRPVLASLPGGKGPNLNTISAEVLAALLPRQSLATLAALLEAERPFKDVDSALAWIETRAGPDGRALMEALEADVTSDWFVARITARLDSKSLRRRVVLQRNGAGGCCTIRTALPEVE